MQSQVSWVFPIELSRLETMVCRRLTRNGRLFAFLRRHRHELFDDAFQAELAAMYSDMPRGNPPKPPALLAMVTLLQAYEGKSDASAVEEAVFDRRWQMVLDCMGTDAPIFSQGVLVDFRRRLIEHELDRRLLDRTVELARKKGGFGDKALRVALDSSPLWGAGRVEDTFNLLGHALEVVVDCAAHVLNVSAENVRADAKLKLLGGSSLKAALDIDWDKDDEQARALGRLVDEVRTLRAWLQSKLPGQLDLPPLKEAIALVESLISQDLEPDPGGGMRIKRGVAKDRRVSIVDPDMRHGRKSKSKLFNGYKRHVARDLDSKMILAATVRPGNEPEHLAAELIRPDVEAHGSVEELHIDRGYLASTWTRQMFEHGERILAKPWTPRNGDRFPKTDFLIDLDRGTVRCPEQQLAVIRSDIARFNSERCDVCPSRDRCTRAALGNGRTISIHPDERMMLQLRALKSSAEGRKDLRQRVSIEHALAHVGRRQGPRARYIGVRKNVLDLRRICAVENLVTLDRPLRAA
jgi:Transposase DDE domain/Transposase domain (DUF772)